MLIMLNKIQFNLFLEHDSRLGFTFRVLVRFEFRLRLVLGLWLGCVWARPGYG